MNHVLETDASPMGLVFAIILYLLVAFWVSTTRVRPAIKWLVWAGLALRVLGAFGRETIKADAVRYFKFGASHAQRFANFDFSPFWDTNQWWGEYFVGTNFVAYPAGFIIAVVGQNLMAVFLIYSLLGFAGIVAYGRAFQNSLPRAVPVGYWAWLCLFPSLWFWPSSIGKEALMMLGLGVATLAYLRYDGRTKWITLFLGLGLVYCIRPQVVAVFIVAMILATFLEFDRWTPVRSLQAIVLLVAGFFLMWYSLQFAVEAEGASGVNDYIATNAQQSTQGGSEVGAASLSPLGIFNSILNVLFRPFIWEAHNFAAAVSALEVLLMWIVVFIRRNQIVAVLRVWREHRALRFSLAFTVLYVVALGMSLGNMGIIARQRVLVFPLLFLLVEAGTMLMAAQERGQPWRMPQFSGRYMPPARRPSPSH